MLPSPVFEGLGFRTILHGACKTFDACGPQRRFPALQPDLSGGTTPCFRYSDASPQLHGSLAVTVSRLSLAGLHRLSSGHAAQEYEEEDVLSVTVTRTTEEHVLVGRSRDR